MSTLVRDDSWATYAALDAVNWTTLKRMGESPKHYKHGLEHPRADTAALALGRYVHTAVLQPHRLEQDFAIYADGDRRGAAWKDFQEAHPGKTIFKASEVQAMRGVVDALKRAAEPFLSRSARVERTIVWEDPSTEVRCKARPDLADPGELLVLDLKTARSIELRALGNIIARFGYHGQLAHYGFGLAEALGWTPERHVLICVESAPPHDCGVFDLDPDVVQVGREMVVSYLELLAECRESGEWPGQYPAPVLLDHTNLPPWVFGGSPEFSFEGDGE